MMSTTRTRSPVAAESAPDIKKQRPDPPPAPAAADNSDDEKSDQDLVVDEVNDVSVSAFIIEK